MENIIDQTLKELKKENKLKLKEKEKKEQERIKNNEKLFLERKEKELEMFKMIQNVINKHCSKSFCFISNNEKFELALLEIVPIEDDVEFIWYGFNKNSFVNETHYATRICDGKIFYLEHIFENTIPISKEELNEKVKMNIKKSIDTLLSSLF
jgi:hypothetical protein